MSREPLVLERATEMPASAERLWRWHAAPGAFERLSPPWERVEVMSRTGRGVENGSRVTLGVPAGPFRTTWVAEHRDVRPGESFRDVQVAGPFARFDHLHRMEPAGPGRSILRDRIEFEPPLGALGRAVAGIAIRRKLERLFEYRHAVTRDDLAAHAAAEGAGSMDIVVTGATGLVGSPLCAMLTTGGHRVVRAVRRPAGPGEVTWDPERGSAEFGSSGPADAIIHLAGESVAQRWNDESKRRIMESRVKGTRAIAEAAARAERRPSVLVCASAVGWYGAGPGVGRTVDESGPRGTGFLADVADAWERAADPARQAGIRVVHVRLGVVLSPKGGALAKMLTPFKLGLGGVIGSGTQGFPWISIDDAVGAFHHALVTSSVSGPVNAVAPETCDNRGFTKTLGRVLSRPTLFPMPAFAARLAFGEMANEMLLAGPQVVPAALQASGYRFRQPTLEAALRHVLGR